ncbi:Phosphatidylinositol-4-phosphate 5-kinase [Coemansia sp. IMI 203386]|nr:Phosphatidylinositol-4-phosphate 5-kinase [Coemansia sp. IMI 203386]
MVLLACQDAALANKLDRAKVHAKTPSSAYYLPKEQHTSLVQKEPSFVSSESAAKNESRRESDRFSNNAILTPITGSSFDDSHFIVSGPLLPIRQTRRGINPNRNYRIVGSHTYMAADIHHNQESMSALVAPPTPMSASVSSASYSSHALDPAPELDSAASSVSSSKSTLPASAGAAAAVHRPSDGLLAVQNEHFRGAHKYDKYRTPSIQELPAESLMLQHHYGSASAAVSNSSASHRSAQHTHTPSHASDYETRSSAVRVSSLLPGARASHAGMPRAGVRKSVSPTDSFVATAGGGMAVQQQYLVQRVPNKIYSESGELRSNESISLSSSQIRLASPKTRLTEQMQQRSLSPEVPDALFGPSVRGKTAATNEGVPSYYADTEMDATHLDARAVPQGRPEVAGRMAGKERKEARESWNIPSDDDCTRMTERQRKRQGLHASTTTERFHVRPLPLIPNNSTGGQILADKPSLSTILTDSPVDAYYHTSSPLSASISMKSYRPALTDYLYGASSADELPGTHADELHCQVSSVSINKSRPSLARDPAHQRLSHDHRATSFDLGSIGREPKSMSAKQHFASSTAYPQNPHIARSTSHVSIGARTTVSTRQAGPRGSSEALAASSPRVHMAPTERVEEGYEGDSEGILGTGSRFPVQRRNTVAGDLVEGMPELGQRPPRMKMVRNTSDFAGLIYNKEDRRAVRGSRRRSSAHPLTPIGTQIAPGHANYVLMYNMLTGIRVSVSRCEAKDSRPVRFDDYKATHKYSFDVVGDEMTPSSRYDFKFKDYAPWVFRCIREAFHLSTEDYLVSLTDKYILSEVGSSGKSGSFFYYSQDYRFIIKTVHHTEHKFMREILPQYYEFVRDHPNTLLSRIYGLHRIKLPHGRKVHFIVMSNILPPNKDIHAQFDLKGSLLGRELSPELAARPRACMKDKNWLNMRQRLHLGPAKRRAFVKQLIEDVTLLIRLNIMDYSLLIGIHDLNQGNSSKLRDTTLAMFDPQTTDVQQVNRLTRAHTIRKKVVHTDPVALDALPQGTLPPLPESMFQELRHSIFYREDGGILSTDRHDNPAQLIYYLGVIDILTPYNVVKRTEHIFKSMVYDGTQISAVNPRKYGLRFLHFMIRSLDGYEDVLPLLDEFEQTTYEAICREHRVF